MLEKLKNNKINLLGWIVVAVVFILNCIIIYKGTWAFHHSDGSTAVMFAIEQLEQGKLYPNGWHNGTGIWNFGLNTIILPFLNICKEWLNARVCAVITQTLLMVGVLAIFKKMNIISKRWWIVVLALFLPISEVVSEHFYFQATYMTAIMYLAVMILCSYMSMSKKKHISIIGILALIILLYFNIASGYMMILVFVCPMLATLLLQYIQVNHKVPDRKNIVTYGIAMIPLIVGTLAGMISNSHLMNELNAKRDSTGGYIFVTNEEIGNSLIALVNEFVRLFGAADKNAALLSLNGINKALACVYLILMMIIVPYCLIRNYKKLKNDKQRFFVMFSVISSLAVIYIFIFTGMGRARYLLWIYFYSIINLGIWVDNFNNMEFTYAKELKVGFLLYFMVLIVGVYSYYLTYDYETNPDVLGINNRYRDYKIDYELLNYMEENDYTFGYAYYWASYSYTVASSGEVEIAAIDYDWTKPYYWLTSDKWYKDDVHEGECFVLVLNRQLETLPQEYVDKAIRRDEYNNHTIFIYDDVKTVHSIWNVLSGFQN